MAGLRSTTVVMQGRCSGSLRRVCSYTACAKAIECMIWWYRLQATGVVHVLPTMLLEQQPGYFRTGRYDALKLVDSQGKVPSTTPDTRTSRAYHQFRWRRSKRGTLWLVGLARSLRAATQATETHCSGPGTFKGLGGVEDRLTVEDGPAPGAGSAWPRVRDVSRCSLAEECIGHGTRPGRVGLSTCVWVCLVEMSAG